jgi:arginase
MFSAKPFTLIGAPIDSVGGAGGTELSPGILRAAADWRRVTNHDRGDVPNAIRDRHRNGETGIVGSDEVIAVTRALRREIAETTKDGRRPILLGGCCTQVVGALAGARDALGRVGVAYLDGHLDLYDGVTSPTGEGADMPLATMLGRGPAAWGDAAGGASLLPEDVALVGPRDHDDAASRGSILPADFSPALALWTNRDIHADGGAHVAQQVRSKFDASAIPFWLAIDVDILDPAVFPATDYLQPDGLAWEDFASLVRNLAASPQLMGVSVACYNPEKDPGYQVGRRLAALLVDSLKEQIA